MKLTLSQALKKAKRLEKQGLQIDLKKLIRQVLKEMRK